ncbi:TPA: HAD hydrolase family protein [Streptococcus pneumoniae]
MSQVKGLCVLDVDGTLILEEVIDLLGREAGHEAEISQITSRAMRGELVFESSLRKRVSLLEGLPIISPQVKKETLEKWRKKLKLSKERTVAIGDGVNNLLMLKSAELGIAFCSKEMLKKEIPHHVDKRDFLEVLPLIDCLE